MNDPTLFDHAKGRLLSDMMPEWCGFVPTAVEYGRIVGHFVGRLTWVTLHDLKLRRSDISSIGFTESGGMDVEETITKICPELAGGLPLAYELSDDQNVVKILYAHWKLPHWTSGPPYPEIRLDRQDNGTRADGYKHGGGPHVGGA